MSVIDFHSHILPDIDDGSKDTAMSGQMLRMAGEQGVRVMVATPHFYGDRDTVKKFLLRRSRALEAVLPLADEAGVTMLAGAEVAFFDYMSQAEELGLLAIEKTGVLLIEMPFRAWGKREIQELDRLMGRGYRLILAHLERYLGFQKDKGIMEAVWERPLFIQINAESLLGFWNRKTSLKLLKENRAHLLGSDCHNLSSRPPNLQLGRAVIEKKLGAEKLAQIDKQGEEILQSGQH